MNLWDIYCKEGRAGLRRLADASGKNEKYLYQLATGRKLPSPYFAWELVELDRRIRFPDLFESAKGRRRGEG